MAQPLLIVEEGSVVSFERGESDGPAVVHFHRQAPMPYLLPGTNILVVEEGSLVKSVPDEWRVLTIKRGSVPPVLIGGS